MPLTPADVRNKQFSTTRLRPGYDEEEVDAFLDEVEAELDRLIQENEELRAKLAEVLRGGKMAAPLSSPHMDGPELMPSEPMREPERRPEPMPMMKSSAEDNMDTAARVLALAQQTADQAIADARRESSGMPRSGTARQWARLCSPARSLSGASTTCGRSSASTGAGSRPTSKASYATLRPAPQTAACSQPWRPQVPSQQFPSASVTCAAGRPVARSPGCLSRWVTMAATARPTAVSTTVGSRSSA